MRICIVAEHASAKFGGEAILPVHYFRQLRSRGIETWLVVHARTRGELGELFPQEADRIFYVPDLWIHKVLYRLSTYLPRRISEATLGLANQLITQFCQRSLVRKLVAEQQIEVIHQPIPVAPRFPSMLFGLGTPVVIGPMNGGMEYPWAFRRNESRISRIAIAAARQFVNIANSVLPGKKYADVVLVANERTRKALPAGLRGEVIELVENGIDLAVWQNASSQQPDEPEERGRGLVPRFVFIGRLVDWKALDIVIRALVRVPAAELEVIGDGSMAANWKALAGELGIQNRIHFSGWLSQQECARRLRACVALVLPSLYECGGAVVLEAMAMGRPVIATNWGGPADYLNASCGMLIEPESYSSLVEGFAAAMQRVIDSPERAAAMGAAGRERAIQDFDWRRKVDRVIGIYRSVIENSRVSHPSSRNRVAPGAAS